MQGQLADIKGISTKILKTLMFEIKQIQYLDEKHYTLFLQNKVVKPFLQSVKPHSNIIQNNKRIVNLNHTGCQYNNTIANRYSY